MHRSKIVSIHTCLYHRITLLFFIIVLSFPSLSQHKNDTPNIILIYMDDMGYADVAAYGALDYPTPNIDKLAAKGMRFTNFYAAQAICTASRAALLTGCYPNRIGIHGALQPNSSIGINDTEETIAEILKKRGYHTAIIGKWHLGDAKKFLPLQHGFDEYFGLPYSNDMWPVNFDGKPVQPTDTIAAAKLNKPPLPLIEGNTPVRFINTLEDQAMLTTWYTEKAINFINRKKKEPFFLYFAHSMVHIPLAVSDKFKGKSKRGLFGDVMMEVDWSVGEIIKTLEKNGITNNTLIIFASDNGPWLRFGDHAGSAGGLREGKGTSWEGGQKVPAIFCWPGTIPQGTVCNNLSSTIDILPTLAAITHSPLPIHRIDGINILPLLKAEPGANPRSQLYYYFSKNNLEAVREESWKLILPHSYSSVENETPGSNGWPGKMHRTNVGLALYDLRRDPGERYDVKDQYPEIVERLQQLAEQARADLGDDLTGRKGKNRRPPGEL